MNDNFPAEPSDRSIIIECDLDEPPEKVWRALTVPEIVATWLMPNDMRPEIGNRFTLKGTDAREGDIACEVLAAEPNRYLRYSWRGGDAERDAQGRPLDTVVTFVLTETEAGGTHLRLVHGGFPAMSCLGTSPSAGACGFTHPAGHLSHQGRGGAHCRRPALGMAANSYAIAPGQRRRPPPSLPTTLPQWSLRWAA